MNWSQVRGLPSSVYFAAQGRLIKIGASRDIGQRIASLEHFFPNLKLLCSVAGSCRDENFIHQIYREEWHHLEWFSLSAELQYLIDCCRSDGALPPFARAPRNWKLKNLPHQHIGRRQPMRVAA